MINLHRLDLNLLRTLDVLLSENNVTRAAQRLNLSQPSVSIRLARLREIFADPLLMPGPRGMQPTARADELRQPLRAALAALEQAVAREVMEESGIKVKNLRYVTSQPWPFPQSLMTAFMADYDSGEIVIDQKELLDANWYRYDDLPLLPPPGTVARRLIEDTVAMCRAEYE